MRYLCQPPRALERLHRSRTYYEAALMRGHTVVAVLAYDQKRTKRALLQAMMNHGPELLTFTALPEGEDVTWIGSAWLFGSTGYAVRWTGATEYERASQALQGIAA